MSEKTKPLTPSNNYIWDLEVELRCAENPSIAKMYHDDSYKPSMRTLKKEMRILEEACDYHHAMFLDEKYYDMLHVDKEPFILPEHSQETLDALNEFMYSKIHSAVHSPNSEYYVPVVANSVPMEEMLVFCFYKFTDFFS